MLDEVEFVWGRAGGGGRQTVLRRLLCLAVLSMISLRNRWRANRPGPSGLAPQPPAPVSLDIDPETAPERSQYLQRALYSFPLACRGLRRGACHTHHAASQPDLQLGLVCTLLAGRFALSGHTL